MLIHFLPPVNENLKKNKLPLTHMKAWYSSRDKIRV